MNSSIDNPEVVYWFSRSHETLNRLNTDVQPLCKIDWQNDFQESQLLFLNSLPPGHVIVFELQRDFMGSMENTIQGDAAKQLNQILVQGNLQIVVCLGDMIPAEVAVDWMRSGLFVYAERECSSTRLGWILQAAIEQAHRLRVRYERFQVLDSHWKNLSPRELAVLEMILDGIPNKAIAAKLGVSQRTIEARRQKLYQKLESKSLPGVVQTMCEWKQLSSEFEKQPTLNPSLPPRPKLLDHSPVNTPATHA